MANINYTNFTWSKKDIEDLSQIEMGYSITQEIQQYVSFQTGINCKTQLGFYYPTGDVGRPMSNCTVTANWDNTPVGMWLEPKWWAFQTEKCAVSPNMVLNIEHNSLTSNMPTTDISQTTVARTISTWILNDLRMAIWRYVFFNDTLESNQAASSGNKHITSGYDSTLVTWCDGLFSKAGQKTQTADVVISENAATTTAGQLALTPDNAYKYMHDLIIPYSPASISHIIAAQPDAQVLCTMTLYNALKTYFHGKTADTGYLYITQDKEMMFNGIRIIGMPMWDYWINRIYWDPDGTTAANSVWFKPHRAIFTPRSNMVVAINNNTVYDNLDVSYSTSDRKVRWITDGLFDVKLRQPDYCLFAL